MKTRWPNEAQNVLFGCINPEVHEEGWDCCNFSARTLSAKGSGGLINPPMALSTPNLHPQLLQDPAQAPKFGFPPFPPPNPMCFRSCVCTVWQNLCPRSVWVVGRVMKWGKKRCFWSCLCGSRMGPMLGGVGQDRSGLSPCAQGQHSKEKHHGAGKRGTVTNWVRTALNSAAPLAP